MPSKHYYTHSSGYCFSPANPNGVFTPSNNNPKNLRAHLDIALSSKTVAWHSNGNVDDNCEPEPVEACDISDLPDVETTLLPALEAGNCISRFNTFYTNLNAISLCDTEPTILDKFLCVLNWISSQPFLLYADVGIPGPTSPCADQYEVVIIFDNKLPISWGNLKFLGPDLIKQIAPLPFPLSFSKFAISMHSLVSDIYYVDPSGIFT